MSYSSELHLDAKPEAGFAWRSRLSQLGARFFSFPGFTRLRPYARKLFLVTEPAGRVYVRHLPAAPTLRECDNLTVISANLWHDWPLHRHLTDRLEGFARLVEQFQADVLLLQEVVRLPGFHADEWLAERLGMAGAYSRANGHQAGIGFEEGVAVLSRFPIGGLEIKQLGSGSNPFVRRLGLGATIHSPCGPVMAFTVHLSLSPRKNATQLADLFSWVAKVAREKVALIGGDFNAAEGSPQIHSARSRWLDTFRYLHPERDGTTHELRLPWGNILRRARLDYIFMHSNRPRWSILEAAHLKKAERGHSDHHAVLLRISPIFAPQNHAISQRDIRSAIY